MNRLKELRLAHGYKSQKELADVLFVNQTAVSQWERGVTMPSSQMLLKLSSMYGVSTDYILGNSDKEFVDKKEQPPAGGGELSSEDLELLTAYRGAPANVQEAIRTLLTGK
ncbi:MAG: helix-turn-helix transcriptional regulator [Oscillibacter sp.]|nr:helix-turn-helix transcriptional regulator [Oscillibacter sp.]